MSDMNGHKPQGWLAQWLRSVFGAPSHRDDEIEAMMNRLRQKRGRLSDSYDEVIESVRAGERTRR
jgi:hypothetical protein